MKATPAKMKVWPLILVAAAYFVAASKETEKFFETAAVFTGDFVTTTLADLSVLSNLEGRLFPTANHHDAGTEIQEDSEMEEYSLMTVFEEDLPALEEDSPAQEDDLVKGFVFVPLDTSKKDDVISMFKYKLGSKKVASMLVQLANWGDYHQLPLKLQKKERVAEMFIHPQAKIFFFKMIKIDKFDPLDVDSFTRLHELIDKIFSYQSLKKKIIKNRESFDTVVFTGFQSGGALAQLAALKFEQLKRELLLNVPVYSVSFGHFPIFTDFIKNCQYDMKKHISFIGIEAFVNMAPNTLHSRLYSLGYEHSIVPYLKKNEYFTNLVSRNAIGQINSIDFSSIKSMSDLWKFAWPSYSTDYLAFINYLNKCAFESKDQFTSIQMFRSAKIAFQDVQIKNVIKNENGFCIGQLEAMLGSLELGNFKCSSVKDTEDLVSTTECTVKFRNQHLTFSYAVSATEPLEKRRRIQLDKSFAGVNDSTWNKCIKKSKAHYEANQFFLINPFDPESAGFRTVYNFNPSSKCRASLNHDKAVEMISLLLESSKETYELIYGVALIGEEGKILRGPYAAECSEIPFYKPELSLSFYDLHGSQNAFEALSSSNPLNGSIISSSLNFEEDCIDFSIISKAIQEKSIEKGFNCFDGPFRTTKHCPTLCIISPSKEACSCVFSIPSANLFFSLSDSCAEAALTNYRPEASTESWIIGEESGEFVSVKVQSEKTLRKYSKKAGFFSWLKSKSFIITVFQDKSDWWKRLE